MSNTQHAEELRRQAEERLAARESRIATLERADLVSLAHELAVHQMELEIQNEELRRAQLEAQDARDRYLDLYDFAPVGYFTLDEHGRVAEANLTGCRLLSMERHDLLKTRFAKFLREEDADAFYFHRKAVLERGVRRTCELKMVKADGAGFDARLESIKSGEGRLRVAVIDVTDRKQAEDALRERLKELACLYAVSRAMQEDFSMEELCRYAVEHLVPAMQFPEVTVPVIELNGKRFISGNYAEGLSHGLHAAIRVGGEVLGHLRVYYTEERPFLIPEEQNLVNGVAEALSTRLVRKHAEEEVRRSEERYHRLFEDDLAGDFISTPEGRILLCNPAFARLFEFSSVEEAVGTSLRDLYVDPREREPLLERLQRQRKVERLEVWWKRRDGKLVHIVENLVGHFNERGELYEVQGYLLDDTERKRAEEGLRELTMTLESKVAQRTAELERRAWQLQKLTLQLSLSEERERRRIAQILHDDLQQVLAAAKFHLSLLKSRVAQVPSQEAIAVTVDEMLKEAVEKSRSLSHDLSPAVVSMNDLAEVLQWLVKRMRAQQGLIVHVEVVGDMILPSEALAMFLSRAAQEMLFNVVKHAQVREARIRIRRWGRYLGMSISDRGRGFDPQALRETDGLGLLSIRERVELLGGRMKIRSSKGEGSTFRIVVPDGELIGTDMERKWEPTGLVTGAKHAPGQDRFRLRVLLADDHQIVREGIAALLAEERDIEVVAEAATGRAAVDLADRLHPDVVVMDVSMPLMSGDEATRQIKAHLPKTRIVALSMFGEAEVVDRMHRAGAESYVLKTCPADELLAAIRGQGAGSP